MLSSLTCQDYKDGDLADALALGCDAVQLKEDGWWTHVAWRHDQLLLNSKTCRQFMVRPAPLDFCADLIAETMHGTQWAQQLKHKGLVKVFDVWGLVNEDVRPLPYRERMSRLAVIWRSLPIPDPLRIVPTYPISAFPKLWEIVERGEYEGVVFRKTTDVGTPTLVRRKNEITAELRFERCIEGDGRHQGRMGSAVGTTAEGIEVIVGGGWSDEQRDEIWANPEKFAGRWFTITAKARFESGLYRHPNFKCWREDLE